MAFDILVKGGTLPDGTIADIGIAGETIAAVGRLGEAEAGQVIDATGDLVAPPVPEPATYALMLGGLALVSLIARRRAR